MASHGIFYSMASIQSCHEFFQEMKEFLIRFFPFPHTSLLSYTSVVVSMHSHFAFRSHLYHYIYIYIFFFLLIENQYPSSGILFDFWLSIDLVRAPIIEITLLRKLRKTKMEENTSFPTSIRIKHGLIHFF